MEYTNYIKIKNKVPFRSSFCYIDTEKYICDKIFLDHELYGVRFFKTELHKPGSEFVIVRCSIFTKDIPKFKECMEHLRRKIEFFDYDIEEYDCFSAMFTLINLEYGELDYE